MQHKLIKPKKQEPEIIDIHVLNSDRQLLIIRTAAYGMEIYLGLIVDSMGLILYEVKGMSEQGVKKSVFNKLDKYLK